MKKLYLFAAFAFMPLLLCAQDVIVKKDGTTIVAKVQKIGTAEVEYKKFNNMEGPTYAISKEEVRSINYENGLQDVFEEKAIGSRKSAGASPENEMLIERFNTGTVKYLGSDFDKTCEYMIFPFAISNESVIQNADVSLSFNTVKINDEKGVVESYPIDDRTVTKTWQGKYAPCFGVVLSITNRTDKIVYVDLAQSHVGFNGMALPYYVPSSQTQTVSTTVGGGIGLNVLGTGLGIGASETQGTINTVYSQRIISIPPMSSRSLEPCVITDAFQKSYIGFVLKYLHVNNGVKTVGKGIGYKGIGLKNGERFPVDENISPAVSFFVSYGFEEAAAGTNTVSAKLYMKEILGVEASHYNLDYKKFDISGCPFFLFVSNRYFLKEFKSYLGE